MNSVALKPHAPLARAIAPATFKIHRTHVARHTLKTRISRKNLASASNGTEVTSPGWDHVLVAIIDSNPALSTSSRQALASAASLATTALTVLFLDDEGKPIDTSRAQMVQKQLEEHGLGTKISILEESIEHSSGKGSVAVGEAADACSADLVVLSSAAVHDKHVDANLLAEFVPAPVLLLP